MKREYGFTGREALGWLRVCRPGSVSGNQQSFLLRFMSDEYGYNSFSGYNTLRPKTSKSFVDRNICTLDLSYETAHLTPENEPPIKRIFTNPSKGFRLSTICIADYYNNNPKTRREEPKRVRVTKFWTMPRESLPPVITLPLGGGVVATPHRRFRLRR